MGTQQSSTGRVASNGRALPSSLPIIPSDVATDAGAGIASGEHASAGMRCDASAGMTVATAARVCAAYWNLLPHRARVETCLAVYRAARAYRASKGGAL